MESGIYRPSSEYLQTIAQRTGFTAGFFEDRGEMPDFPFGSMLYRAQAAVKQGSRTKAHAMTHVAFELALNLAGRLKKVPINIPEAGGGPSSVRARIYERLPWPVPRILQYAA